MSSRQWWDHTTADFARRDLSNTVVILPVGAVEQHGPHLPVRVDAAINAGILDAALARIPEGADVLVLPPLPYGKSDEHLAFPGTLAISAETLSAMWFEIASHVARAGARKLIFFNSHGGQTALIDICCRRIRVDLGLLAVACSWFRITPVHDLVAAGEVEHGIHAGDIETSVMLALHGDLVDMSKAENFVPLTVALSASGGALTAEGAVGFGWQAQDLHPSGAMGDATAARADKGREIVERASAALARLVGDVAAFDMSLLTSRTRYSR